MTHYTKEFPFKEIRDDGTPEGDYFHRPQDIRKLGYAESQIWSIYEGDEEIRKDGQRFSVYVYGPSRHYINVIGYIATKEHHDGNTYYAETLEMEPYPEGWDDGVQEPTRSWIVCWTTTHATKTFMGALDHWDVFESYDEANKKYKELYHNENVCVRSMCAVMYSSDYEPHPAFSEPKQMTEAEYQAAVNS